MRPRRILAVFASLGLALSLGACADDEPAVDGGRESLVIGVSLTEPGLSAAGPDGPVGFDVDVATYVARRLGWSDSEIEFRTVVATDRQSALESGTVDMVVAAYAITAERAEGVAFAGPYLLAGQDLMVPFDNADVTGPHSLRGKVVCAASGTAATAIRSPEYSAGATVRVLADTGACVEALLSGRVDAVTADDVVLTGYAAQHRGDVKVLGSPFTTEAYGIGLPKSSPDVDVINDVLQQMIDDGTWASDYEKALGTTAPLPPTPGG